MKKVFLAYPRGFCAGVRRALETVDMALNSWKGTVYVLHEIVHNEFVVNNLRKRGVVFVENISSVPEGGVVIFSAHGVSKEIENEAIKRNLQIIDATCPLVKKIHHKAIDLLKRGYLIFLIGHRQHPEIQGTLGQLDNQAFILQSPEEAVKAVKNIPSNSKAAFLTQTTLSISDTQAIVCELKNHFPNIQGDLDICYATANRQNAIRELAQRCDTVLVIGSPKSSNSNRLREVAEQAGTRSYLIRDASEVTPKMLEKVNNLGVSAGASAPEYLVHDLCEHLVFLGWPKPETIECASETISFNIPQFNFRNED